MSTKPAVSTKRKAKSPAKPTQVPLSAREKNYPEKNKTFNLKAATATSQSPEPSSGNEDLDHAPKKRLKKAESEIVFVNHHPQSLGNTEPDAKVDWEKDGLTWALIAAIEDDDAIRQGLFPSSGNGTRLSNGKPKTDHYRALAELIFGTHVDYSAAYALAKKGKTAKERDVWMVKIKNRIVALTRQTRTYQIEMGEPGADIEREDEIDMEAENSLTTKWAQIKSVFPWYWRLKALIGEQLPCIRPVGVGNSATDIDMSVLMPGITSSNTGNDSAEDSEATSESDELTEAMARPSKHQKAVDRFLEVALKEEEIAQKNIAAKHARFVAASHRELERIKAKAEITINRDNRKADYQIKRLELAHAMKMEEMRLRYQSIVPHASSSTPAIGRQLLGSRPEPI